MKVTVQNIASGKEDGTTLPDVARVGFSQAMMPRLAGIWEGFAGVGIVINLTGPFVISHGGPEAEAFAWQYPLIQEPPCSV